MNRFVSFCDSNSFSGASLIHAAFNTFFSHRLHDLIYHSQMRLTAGKIRRGIDGAFGT